MKFLEYMFYESLPYIYGSIGVFAMTQHETSKVAAIGGLILALCSYQVFYKRYFHRTYTAKMQKQLHI